MSNDHMTTQELAAYLHIPVNTVRDWRKKGRGPLGVRYEGGRVYYRRIHVHDWQRQQQHRDPLARVS